MDTLSSVYPCQDPNEQPPPWYESSKPSVTCHTKSPEDPVKTLQRSSPFLLISQIVASSSAQVSNPAAQRPLSCMFSLFPWSSVMGNLKTMAAEKEWKYEQQMTYETYSCQPVSSHAIKTHKIIRNVWTARHRFTSTGSFYVCFLWVPPPPHRT